MRQLSPICNVHFMGFYSDTLRLQNSGWDLYIEYDISYNKTRLFIENTHIKLMGFSEQAPYIFQEYNGRVDHPPSFNIIHVTSKIDTIRTTEDFSNFERIDARTQWTSNPFTSMRDLNPFVPKTDNAEEIIVDPLTIADMLSRIKELQSKDQSAIRARERLRERAEQPFETLLHAKIISFSDMKNAA
jgi:hypothetical protein